MSNREILEWVEILKFDYKKHDSLQRALKELLSNDNYMNVIRGKETDVKYLREVQEIYEAFKKLKSLELEQIIKVIKEEAKEDEVISEEILEEVIAFDEGEMHLLMKN